MPEGHSVHRIALQLEADFVGRTVRASSPQGRFAAGAQLIDGATPASARAVGKHLLVSFERPGEAEVRWLRVHLGLYGAWDLHGRVSPIGDDAVAMGSIGAPRQRASVALRMGEEDRELADDATQPFPPPPVGQVRLRLMTEHTVADLRGPSRCEVITPDDVLALLAKAGPDPRVTSWPDPVTGEPFEPWPDAEGTFVSRLTSRGVAVGQLLMDQSVVSGIGNIYRAEMLFHAGLDPWTPGRRVPAEVARALWRDWVRLLADGVRTGFMLTRTELAYRPDGANAAARADAIADVALRHAVYGRAGEPCYECGTPVTVELMAARKLYWCKSCQV